MRSGGDPRIRSPRGTRGIRGRLGALGGAMCLLSATAVAQTPRTPPANASLDPVVSTAKAEFVHFESGPVRPLLLLDGGDVLAVLNTADGRLELYDARNPAGGLALQASVFTGLEPVALVAHPGDPDRLFVSNHVSDTVSVVHRSTGHVEATIPVGDEPQGLVVADGKLFVACARASTTPLAPGGVDPNPVQDHVVVVTSAEPPYAWIANVPVQGVGPRDLAVADGKVWVIPQDSGNRTTLLDETAADQLGITQLTPDRFQQRVDVNPILTKPALNNPAVGRGWRIPFAGRIVFDFEYPQIHDPLPDRDVVGIDPSTLSVLPQPATNVGTTLLDVETNPYSGLLWVLGTEALNRFRFEPRLRGQAVENRITLVQPGGTAVDLVKLAPPEMPRAYAQPVDVAFGTDAAPRAFVACLGSSAVVVLDALSGVFVEEIAVGAMPIGLALDGERAILYVLGMGQHAVQAYDVAVTGATPLGPARPLAYDPEPPPVRAGRRHLYTALPDAGHGNGSASCASCHVFGHHDASAWDLGDAEGSLAYYYPEIMTGVNGFDGYEVVDFFTPIASPLKGPMVTQSLRGLLEPPGRKDDRPLHWRGDRVLFQMFRGAFHGLLGGPGIGARDIQEFAAFLRSLEYAPNPHQRKDRQYAGAEDVGRDKFGMNLQFHGKDYVADTDRSCISCHHGNFFDGSDHTGSRQTVSVGAFSQIFNTSQLRAVYEKHDRELTGFGSVHDGAFDGVRGFLDANVPRGGEPIFSNFTAADRDEVAAFVEQWDHGLGPMVGAQFTVDSTNDVEGLAFLSRALPAAEAAVPHADLILKGYRESGGLRLSRGAVYVYDTVQARWLWQFDTGDRVDTDTVMLVARAGLARWTFTGVPPGLGVRLGIDRDEDGLFDEQERAAGTDECRPDHDGDGFADGAEVLAGSDPRRWEDRPVDGQAPGFLRAFAAEIGADTASFTAVLDEPVQLRLRLGTTAGGADLGRHRAEGRRCRHDLILTELPADTEVFWTAVATDSGGNVSRQHGSLRTFVPLFHVEDLSLDVQGSGPYTAVARLLIHDHRGQPVVGLPATGFWDGDIGAQNWVQEAVSDADGWAEFPLAAFDPAGPTTLAFSPAYLGSADPADPWFCGVGGQRPRHFYDQSANSAHYVQVDLP